MQDHFYSAKSEEVSSSIRNAGYHLEGIACFGWNNPPAEEETTQLYRLFNGEDHFYTTDAHERDQAINNDGYRSEGIACSVYRTRWSPLGFSLCELYRLYNGQDHFYTTDPNERDHAINNYSYRSEGCAGCVINIAAVGAPIVERLAPLYRLYNG